MHTKNLRMLLLGVFALFVSGVHTLSVFASPPKMTEYFRYDQSSGQGNALIDKDLFVLDTLSVTGERVQDNPVKITPQRPDLEPRHFHAMGVEIKIVTDLGPDDLLTTINMSGPSDLVQKLQNTTNIGGVNIYIKSGIAWKIDNDLSFVFPYARGRVFGVAVKYKSPTRWSRELSYSHFR